MKKSLIFILLLIPVVKIQSQDYLISFAGSGASTTVDNIKVENLTQNKSITVFGDNQLRLKADYSKINSINDNSGQVLIIYPNPAKEYFNVEFNLLKGSIVTFEILDLSGRQLVQKKTNFERGNHIISISGLGSGVYTVNLKTDYYNYSGKIISQSNNSGEIQITCIDKLKEIENTKTNKFKSTDAETTMQYNAGDRLKFTGKSGTYRTVFIDVPIESKTITFTFVGCGDIDNNNYPIVSIGTQIWMAENLITTKLNNGDAILNVTNNIDWESLSTPGYCWYSNDSATYKSHYGSLYNLYTVKTNKLCPTGWHVPTNEEWSILLNYLSTNDYGYEGNGDNIAKSLAASINWQGSGTSGNVGNDEKSNNASGFSAFPSGGRGGDGSFAGNGFSTSFWTSTPNGPNGGIARIITYIFSIVLESGCDGENGNSVRCLKD
jgi:uncharacterized protein (TIGR02145 family)